MPSAVVAAVAPETRAEEEFEKYTCQQCSAKVVGEPRCAECKRCALCCDCKYCLHCEVRCKPCVSCVSCKKHCSCWDCEACSRKHRTSVRKCDVCMACEQACGCWICRMCGVRQKRWKTQGHRGAVPCPECSSCYQCCAKGVVTGSRCRTIRNFNPMKPQFHTALLPAQRTVNRSPRMLSSEIEVAGTQRGSNIFTSAVVAKWGGGIVHDGSLPDGGFEINTAPAGGDHFVNEIQEICDALKQDGGVTDKSCGAHLHIDARDFTPYDLRRVIYLYAHIEDAVYGLVAKERRQNRYCIPCSGKYLEALANGRYTPKDKKKAPSEAAKTKHSLIRGLYGHELGQEMRSVRHDKYNSSRYNALNLHSWMYRGTLETRVLHGTVDPVELQNWGQMWALLIDFAYKNKESTIRELKGSSFQILEGIIAESRLDVAKWMAAQRKRFRGSASPHPEHPIILRPSDSNEVGDEPDFSSDDDSDDGP